MFFAANQTLRQGIVLNHQKRLIPSFSLASSNSLRPTIYDALPSTPLTANSMRADAKA